MNSIFSDQNRVLQEVRTFYTTPNRTDNPYEVVYANLGGRDSLLKKFYLFILSLLGKQSEQEIEIGKAINAYKIESFGNLKEAIFLESSETPEMTKIANIRNKCQQFHPLEIHYVYRNLLNVNGIISSASSAGLEAKNQAWIKICDDIAVEMGSGPIPSLPKQPECYG